MRPPTIGTHNLLDGAAPATGFAAVVFFTEATDGVHALDQRFHVYVCVQQRDLAIAIARTTGGYDLDEHYTRSVFGVRKVSPHRGTYWLTDDIAKVALIVEHRINAAFPPYKRGEALFRRLAWWAHTRMTLRLIRRLKRRGYTIYAGGDLNTPEHVRGYRGQLHEAGFGLDRLGSTEGIKRSAHLSALGSDHKRLRAVV